VAEPLTAGTTRGVGLADVAGDAGAPALPMPVLPAPVGPNAALVAAAPPVPALKAGLVASATELAVDGGATFGVPAPFAVPPPALPVFPPELAPGVPAAPVVPPLPVVP
jgi:hypothetical protein